MLKQYSNRNEANVSGATGGVFKWHQMENI